MIGFGRNLHIVHHPLKLARRFASRSTKDYWSILGLKPGASKTQIKEAYRKKALKHHPDRNPGKNSEEQFKEISEAYRCLVAHATQREFSSGHPNQSPYGGRPWSKPQRMSFQQAKKMFEEDAFFDGFAKGFKGFEDPEFHRAGFNSSGFEQPHFATGPDPFSAPHDDFKSKMDLDDFFSSMNGFPNGFSSQRGQMHKNPFEDMFQNHWQSNAFSSDGRPDEFSGNLDFEVFGHRMNGHRKHQSAKSQMIVKEDVNIEHITKSGKKIKRTIRTITYADGREEELVSEQFLGWAD